ncbi:Outer membrane receptor for ferrienterochelin and colicins [bacterium JGI 053]|nr:Outer membrane receptor for ferrienterochelin and colicins [bacterium JGI 053]
MNRVTQTAAVLLCALLLAFGAAGNARAQAATTSAVSGRVTGDNGQGVAGAQVTATNTENGSVSRTVTSADGRYTITGLQPGSYTLAVSRIGLQTSTRSGLRLSLGQTAQNDFTVTSGAVALTGITAVAERNPIISSGRTGSSSVVSDSTLRRSPSLTRDLQDFTRLVPQMAVTNTQTGAVSAGGRNNRYNNLQIDGAANNDLFGLSGSGSPAGQANGKSITLEAIKEVQVVIAPYDVRQSGFTGASVNAITRSGTNRFEGSLAGYRRNESLTGRYNTFLDTQAIKLRDFSQGSYSGSFGGPIMRDKAFFFVAGELGRREEPGLYAAGDNVLLGVTKQQADLLATQLATLGYDAGTTGPKSYQTPNNNIFGRLDFNLSANNRLTIRDNWISARRENIGRNSTSNYTLGNADYVQFGKTNSLVAQLNSGFGSRFFNEFRVGYLTERDHRETPGDPFPRITVTMSSGRNVIAGTENSSVANVLRQNVLEVTNDLSVSAGAHNLTLGTSNQFINFYNLFFQNGYGLYTFASDSLFLAGRPSSFQVQHPIEGGHPAADFNVRSLSAYLQDRWNTTDNLVVTLGLRLDHSSLPDKPSNNPLVPQFYPGRSTSNVPSPGIIFSPRFGFNWDVTGDKTTQLRGGAGLFAGRPLYVWISNLYGNTGVDYVNFRCPTQALSPTFVANPLNQPTACAGTGVANLIVNTADPNLKPPQVARYDLGVDRQLPFGLVATLEGIYTKTVHDLFYRDLAIVKDPSNAVVEGRPLLKLNTAATPGLGDVFDVSNTPKGYTYSLTAQLQRPFRDDWEASLAYTYGHAKDVNSLTSSVAQSNFSFNVARFDPNSPELATSNYDIPNRVVATASKRFHFFRTLPSDLTVVYIGQSGFAYSYAYNGDINGDGFTANDLIYVPKDVNDILFAGTATVSSAQSAQNFNKFVESVECLREQRGQVMERNSCRLPWSSRVDVKFQQNLSLGGRTAQFSVDVVNFGNLLNSNWGRQLFIGNQSDQILATSGTAVDAAGHRTYAAFNGRLSPFSISDLDSRYQIQLGLRLGF